MTYIIIWPAWPRAQFPWKIIRKNFLYEGRTRRGDRAGKTRTALLEMRTAPQKQCETILLLQKSGHMIKCSRSGRTERNIPSQGIENSPVQRLMDRNWGTRTLLPTISNPPEPSNLNTSQQGEKLRDTQEARQASYCNSNAHDLLVISEGDTVRIKPFVQGQKEWKKSAV